MINHLNKHYFHLQHFDKWWHNSSPAHSNLSNIPTYHIGKFISDTRTYELFHRHELIVMIPAHYKNGVRFLNHIIVCLQELLQHLEPLCHQDILQLKYEAFGREILVLDKIREEFIQEVQNKFKSHQPGVKNTQWMSSVLDSFLAYMYYCGSINPQHKSYMMTILVDDPQTYNWYSWANNQEIPGLWGRLPEHSAEYQTAVLEAIQAKIALEPNMESSGSCSEMWCKGIINMMTQTDKSELDVLKSSADIIENYMCKPVKKGRGRPKGVLNSTIVKIQSLPRSPIKLRGKNSAESSFISQNLDVISKGDLSEVLEDMRDDIPVSRSETSSVTKKLKLWKMISNYFEELAFILKLIEEFQSTRELSQSSQEEQMQSTIAEPTGAPVHVMKTQPNSFRYDDEPSSFSDYTQPWDYSSDTYMVLNEESESSLYDEGIVDQAMDISITFQNNSTSNHRQLSSELSEDVMLSSPTVSLNHSEGFDKITSAPPISSPPSEDNLQMQVDFSPSSPMIEDRESPFIPSLSLSSQEESAQPSSITSKTFKGTLIFTESLDGRFDYDSVIFVPKSKSKGKGKGKGKGKSKDQSDSDRSFQKNHEISPKSTSQTQTITKMEKKEVVNSNEASIAHSSSNIKSMTTLTLSANMSKVAQACQKTQTLSKSKSLMWNEKVLDMSGLNQLSLEAISSRESGSQWPPMMSRHVTFA
ncbi:hypothetical protein BD769DRAFT_1384184 [Suillus cothurnatus]|nr:hypothetical protein BD769DRAFT_1384184 [Suillus cothurnatus]